MSERSTKTGRGSGGSSALRKRAGRSLGAAALACTAFAGVTGVGAAPASATPPPYAHLELTVYAGTDTGGDVVAVADLWCDPDVGSHPDPEAACAALDAVDYDPAALPGEPGICTDEYRPMTATASGHWGGGVHTVEFRRTYSNPCELYRATTPVFDIT